MEELAGALPAPNPSGAGPAGTGIIRDGLRPGWIKKDAFEAERGIDLSPCEFQVATLTESVLVFQGSDQEFMIEHLDGAATGAIQTSNQSPGPEVVDLRPLR